MGNQMQKALVSAGIAEAPKPKRKREGKQFKCKKCGKPMTNPDYVNAMWCEHCDKGVSYFIFQKRK